MLMHNEKQNWKSENLVNVIKNELGDLEENINIKKQVWEGF